MRKIRYVEKLHEKTYKNLLKKAWKSENRGKSLITFMAKKEKRAEALYLIFFLEVIRKPLRYFQDRLFSKYHLP